MLDKASMSYGIHLFSDVAVEKEREVIGQA